MYRDFMSEYATIRQREMRERVEALRKAGMPRERWRSRFARRLVNAAFAVESEASWQVMWEKMSPPAKRTEARK